jgi:hypothetical protein
MGAKDKEGGKMLKNYEVREQILLMSIGLLLLNGLISFLIGWGADVRVTYRDLSNVSSTYRPGYSSQLYIAGHYGQTSYIYKSSDAGHTWSLFGSVNYAVEPSITATSAYLFMAIRGTQTNNVHIHKWTHSGTWLAVYIPDDNPSYVDHHPSIIQLTSCLAMVYSRTISSGDADIRYVRTDLFGAPLDGPLTVIGGGVNWSDYQYPRLAYAYSGGTPYLHLAYSNHDNNRIHYKKSTDWGTSWPYAEQLISSGDDDRYPDLSTSGSSVWVSYCDLSPGNQSFVQQSTNNGNSWSSFTSPYIQHIQLAPNSAVYAGQSAYTSYITCSGEAVSDNSVTMNNPYLIDIIRTSSDWYVVWNEDDIYIDALSWTGIEESASLEQSIFRLEQNYPNPVVCYTEIHYTILQETNVQLQIYDASGRQIITLVDENQRSGNYRVSWNIHNISKKQLPNGIYFYQLKAESYTETNKMIVLR